MLVKASDDFILNTDHIVSIVKTHENNGQVTVTFNMVVSTQNPNCSFTYDAIDITEADELIAKFL
ncbi:hypothetical protein [Acinetobacter pittii]|uniref:hypothetical protein n=1 Tax=Acinetobacter pittii TaxID=48296 RepID=UPI0033337236